MSSSRCHKYTPPTRWLVTPATGFCTFHQSISLSVYEDKVGHTHYSMGSATYYARATLAQLTSPALKTFRDDDLPSTNDPTLHSVHSHSTQYVPHMEKD